MGTALARSGCLEALCRSEPGVVRAVHRSHLEAGAALLRTNTFGGHRVRLAIHGLERDVSALCVAAVACAREAMEQAGRAVPLAGVIGPGGDSGAVRAQAEALALAGVDLLFLETFLGVEDAVAALEAARTSALPVVVFLSPGRDGRLGATTLAEASEALSTADAWGLNCGFGVASITEAFAALPRSRTRLVFPSAGLPSGPPDRLVWPDTAADFARAACDLSAAGATVIGGCCGTTAAHLVAIANAVAKGAAA